MARRSLLIVSSLGLLGFAGCFIDRSGTAPDDGGPNPLDASLDADAGDVDAGLDAGFDAGLDAAPPVDACVATAELCDGVDNDCDPMTADGAGDPALGAACDDPMDPDLCEGGRFECTGGALTCVGDPPGGREELCDGVDNDCNPATVDGSGDPSVGMPCDSTDDVDLCEGGTWACDGSLGALVCMGDDGDTPAEVELCDGIDNDCNSMTLDGAAETTLGDPCDDPADIDLCAEGSVLCSAGALTCWGDDGDQMEEMEFCDGLDNDCNPATADGAADPRIGAACDGPDTDVCAEGTASCMGGVAVCSDATGDSNESCNGLDDDCDGTVDEGTTCSSACVQRTRLGHSYLFCRTTFLNTWTSAQSACRGLGGDYDLVTVDDAAEQAWLATNTPRTDRSYWIGANDRGTEGNFEWSSTGMAISFRNWSAGEPNDASGEDCAELVPLATGSGAMGSATELGGWNDSDCNNGRRFICEASP